VVRAVVQNLASSRNARPYSASEISQRLCLLAEASRLSAQLTILSALARLLLKRVQLQTRRCATPALLLPLAAYANRTLEQFVLVCFRRRSALL